MSERGLFQRGDVYYMDRTVELFNPHRKVRLKQSTGEKTLSAARSVMQRKIKALQQKDAEGEYRRMSLMDGLKKYLDDYSSVHVKNYRDHDLQYRRLNGDVSGHTKFPNKPIDQLIGGDFTSHVATRKREGMANATINQELAFVSGALTWLAGNHNVRVSFISWKDIRLPVFKKKRWATIEQLKLILSLIDNQDEKDLALLLMSTGARLSEDKDIRWSQVSLNEGTIQLYRDKTDNETILALPEDCIAMLTRRYSERKDGDVFVFQSRRRKNQPIHRPRSIDKAIEKSGINDDPVLVKKKGKFTIHSLRDSFASILAQSGEHDLNEIRELLGHTTMTMTKKYAHLIPSEVSRKASATFDAKFTSQL